jgi:hypothetical protein
MNTFINEELLVSSIKRAISELNPESTVTFHEYVKEKYWPFFLSKKRTKAAIRTEEIRLDIILPIVSADLQLIKITENDLTAVLNEISKRRTTRGYIVSSTVNRYRSRFFAIFNHAIREGILKKIRLALIKKRKNIHEKGFSLPKSYCVFWRSVKRAEAVNSTIQ